MKTRQSYGINAKPRKIMKMKKMRMGYTKKKEKNNANG